jgi:hypothetical protein
MCQPEEPSQICREIEEGRGRGQQTESAKDLSEMMPSPSRHEIFRAVHNQFMRCFPEGRIKIGERTWNLAGDPMKVYRLYAAVREAFGGKRRAGVAAGSIRTTKLAFPLPVSWVEIV